VMAEGRSVVPGVAPLGEDGLTDIPYIKSSALRASRGAAT